MKLAASSMLMLILAIIVSACNVTPPKPAAPPAPGATPTAVTPGFNLLVVAEGNVRLKRQGWNDYHATTFGAALQRGDQIWPGNDANTVVLCDNLTTWTVPMGAPAGLTNGCPPPPEPALVRGESRIGHTRGGSDPLIPYILSPRSTRLLSSQPRLRWNTSPGANSYTVKVTGEGVAWQTQVTETQVTYPGDPPLKPGQTYLLTVEADNGKSSKDEGGAGLGFTLVDEVEAQQLQAEAAKISTLNLTDDAKAYALAQLYAGKGLLAEAIDMLEPLVKGPNPTTTVYRTLADFYQQAGLSLPAEANYLKAVELAKAAGDVEGLAEAQAGLGEVYAGLGKKAEAVQFLIDAQAGFQSLGDAPRASAVAARVAELKK